MLRKKRFRDILQNKAQFITIFLMILIGIMVYVGIEAYMDGMIKTADTFYKENNLQDLNVLGKNFTENDLKKIKEIDNVKDAEKKLVVTGIDNKNKNNTYLVSFIDENNISKFYVIEGEKFDINKKGVWVDNFYAKENNLKLGDKISIKYDDLILEEKIIGLINVPDHIYDTKDESEIVPNRKTFGFVYMSINEIDEKIINHNNIPYNYIMVDVNNKKNVEQVKNDIESKITNAQVVIKIEDTASYQMYQGEIDEGKAYIGIFSGLFLFIAILSVITTMNRVVKKQKLQIGTLKALGFKKTKIIKHYIGYGFWISLLAAIFGIILGKYFIGNLFMSLEMSFFEIPNGHAYINKNSYIMAIIVIIIVSLITYLTCYKELKKTPSESLRNEIPKIKTKSLNITTKRPFKNMKFSTKWNLRDISRNKFRTFTTTIAIVGCCTLIVCALGMLNSINYFIKLQFEDLYNFNYKLTLKENISDQTLQNLKNKYGDSTSETIGIEIIDKNKKTSNTIFVNDSNNLIQFQDDKNNYIKLNNNSGVYVTYKLKELNNYKIGDTIIWRIYGDKTIYKSKIVGFNKDPQNQNITATKEYIESLKIKYKPDTLYTNNNLKDIKELEGVTIIKDNNSLKNSMESMLSMTKEMITIIIIFATLLGIVIIYNMGTLSFSEKQYQFATLKVLGFKNKKIRNIFIKQNLWITIISIIIGLPTGYYLTSWLFKKCLDDNFDFGVHINIYTYIFAALLTFLVSYITSNILSKKINKIDMVTSLKGNE